MNSNEDLFKPQSLTIGELFGNKDSLYQIPRYQRPYSWGEDQLIKLWDDLMDAQLFEPNYFLGSIITAKPEDNTSYLDIVDGQQRLTTLLIMICVCRDLFPNLNSDIIEENPHAIDASMIKSSIRLNDRLQRLRLRTHSNHSSDFDELIITDGNTINNTRPKKKDLRIEQAPKYKFMNSSAFFKEKFEELGEKKTGLFINYLFEKVKIIRIDCLSVGFAIKLFQVLNDRGLDLSNSDLIKSFLIGKIYKKYEKDSEVSRQFEDQFLDDWKSCETMAIDTEESMNNLFVMFEYYLLEGNPSKSLYDELKTLFENRDANDVIREFKKFVETYKERIFNSSNKVIYSLYYLRWSVYWRTIVTTAILVDYPQLEEFLVKFRRYYYLNWLAGNTISKIKNTSFKIIALLKAKTPLSEIEQDWNKQLNDDVIQRAIYNLGGEIYFEAWCKPLLFMIEYNQIDNPPFYSMEDKNIQTEHILPQGYSKVEEWKFVNEIPELKEWINTGANLTLLSGRKNREARNYAFERKIKSYDGTGLEDSKDKSVSSFKITQKIVNDYNNQLYKKEWNLKSIEARWMWFCTEIETILNIDLEKIKQKNTIHIEAE
jgi:uncharacterized protein with ParB-like and HNH nuclease domain